MAPAALRVSCDWEEEKSSAAADRDSVESREDSDTCLGREKGKEQVVGHFLALTQPV